MTRTVRHKLTHAELNQILDDTDELQYDAEDPRFYVPTRKVRYQDRVDEPSSSQPIHADKQVPLPTPQGLPFIKKASKGEAPIKVWTNSIESQAWKQLQETAKLSCIHKSGIAAMPDVHFGKGVCIGSVIPTCNALIPAAVSCDIGCGVLAVKLNLAANDLPDNLHDLRLGIEANIPVGKILHRKTVNAGAWQKLEPGYRQLIAQYPRVSMRDPSFQLGTLGNGNHFVEICLDEDQQVWIMLHSGSRGVGGKIGLYFIEQAKNWCYSQGYKLPNQSLAYLKEGTPLFDGYRLGVSWAQQFAHVNREVMLEQTIKAMRQILKQPVTMVDSVVHCHHNYVAQEEHFGELLWITRKGAVAAYLDQLAIIPGSMGTESFIVRGKGNEESCMSCAHGAGRKMSRSLAKQLISKRDLERQTKGVECRKDKAVIDEAPGAYKPIREVMENQKDLVEIVHTLKQVVCIKG